MILVNLSLLSHHMRKINIYFIIYKAVVVIKSESQLNYVNPNQDLKLFHHICIQTPDPTPTLSESLLLTFKTYILIMRLIIVITYSFALYVFNRWQLCISSSLQLRAMILCFAG